MILVELWYVLYAWNSGKTISFSVEITLSFVEEKILWMKCLQTRDFPKADKSDSVKRPSHASGNEVESADI
jgi:hypothetical protein